MIFGLKSRKKPTSYETGEKIIYINPADIIPNEDQPRKYFDETGILRLADSIRRYGMIHPLTVRVPDPDQAPICAESDDGHIDRDCSAGAKLSPTEGFELPETVQASEQTAAARSQRLLHSGRSDIGTETEGGRTVYMLISGERRYRAAVMLGLSAVPCIVKSYDDSQSATVSIVENLLRRDLNMFEQAKAFEKLIAEYGLTQSEVAERLSTSQSCVANKLRLMKLGDQEQCFIIQNGLTERHARALLRITDIPLRKAAMMAIADKKLNVSSAENYIERLIDTPDCPRAEKHTNYGACSRGIAGYNGIPGASAADSDDSAATIAPSSCPTDDSPANTDSSAENTARGPEIVGSDSCFSDNQTEACDNSCDIQVNQSILPAVEYKKKLSDAFGRIFRQLPVETSVAAENDDEIVFTVTVRKSRPV